MNSLPAEVLCWFVRKAPSETGRNKIAQGSMKMLDGAAAVG
jgi:hypothetical protein